MTVCWNLWWMNSSHKYYHPLVHIQNPPNPTPQIQAYLFSLDSLVDIKWKLFLEHVPGALATARTSRILECLTVWLPSMTLMEWPTIFIRSSRHWRSNWNQKGGNQIHVKSGNQIVWTWSLEVHLVLIEVQFMYTVVFHLIPVWRRRKHVLS